MRLSTGIISVLLGKSMASAFSPDDLPLTVAHRLVLHAIEQQSSISPNDSSSARQLSHADNKHRPCSICYDGNDPFHPGRRLQLRIDDASGSFNTSGQEVAINEESPGAQTPLTCVDYESTFLSKLFPNDSSCQAFQVRTAKHMSKDSATQHVIDIYIEYISICMQFNFYMLVPKCALSQFVNWDPSLRTEIHLSQFAHWAPVPKLGSQFAH